MTEPLSLPELRMIPMDRIEILNPRERNQRKFSAIVENIGAVGLKKPVTVTPRPGEDGAERYILVCGEGRFKAFQQLGEKRIPALVVMVSDEDAFVMSLAENVARRRHQPLELLRGITLLRDKGHSVQDISRKTNLHGKRPANPGLPRPVIRRRRVSSGVAGARRCGWPCAWAVA